MWGSSAFHDPTEGFERDFVVRNIEFYRTELVAAHRPTATWCRSPVPEDAIVDVHREWLLIQHQVTLDRRRRQLPGRGAAGRPVRRVPGRRAGTDRAVRAGRAHLAELPRVDPQPPDPGHAAGRAQAAGGADARRRPVAARRAARRARVRPDRPGGHRSLRQRRVHARSPAASPSPARCVTGTSAARRRRSSRRLRSSTPPGWPCGSSSPPPRTAPRCPTSSSGRPARAPGRCCSPGTAVSRSRSPRPTAASSAAAGSPAAAPTWWPTSVAAASTGREWHLSAIKEHRHLVYEDFAAVAADLVTRGIATRDRLGIEGGSNGGLLMGVMLTRYPQLFGAIVSQVPLLDMRRYHELLAGASWMAEYGDPREPAEWDYIRPFSPVPQRLGGRAVPAGPVHHLHQGRPGAPRARQEDGGAAGASRATTSATTRTSRAATARPPTTSSGRSSGRWCSSSSGSG